MVTSRVPAAVAALLDILRAAPSLADVDIVDGPPTVDLTELDRIYVGWQPDGAAAVSLQQDFNGAGARTRDESFAISGYVESRAGDTDMALVRARAFEILGVVETELRATSTATMAPTLNGTVLWSHLTAGDLFQDQREGALAGLNFAVTCFARI